MRARRLIFEREEELCELVSKYAKRRGFTRQARELPFFEYRIDLYGFSKPTGDTIAVELKIKDWRRALYQALIYQLCSDYVFIALPETNARLVDESELARHGVGLIAVGALGQCRVRLEAARSTEVRDHYREQYAEILAR